jgi:hypothetical protein
MMLQLVSSLSADVGRRSGVGPQPYPVRIGIKKTIQNWLAVIIPSWREPDFFPDQR